MIAIGIQGQNHTVYQTYKIGRRVPKL